MAVIKEQQRRLRAFLYQESLIAWLAREIDSPDSLRVKTALEIGTRLIRNGEEIFQRIPPEALRGLAEGDSPNVKAALLLRAEDCSSQTSSRESNKEQKEQRQRELIKTWALSEGVWRNKADAAVASLYTPYTQGGEARVYDAGAYVVKVISTVYFATVQEALDRIHVHNTFFPETEMRVLGFGLNADGDFSVIVSQPFVKGKGIDRECLLDMTTRYGLHKLPHYTLNTEFCNDTYFVGDLHNENVLLTPGGNIAVIDCDARLNTPELGYGGKWEIPQIRYSQEAVRIIDNTIEEIIQGKLSVDFLLSEDKGTNRRETMEVSSQVESDFQISL